MLRFLAPLNVAALFSSLEVGASQTDQKLPQILCCVSLPSNSLWSKGSRPLAAEAGTCN